MTLRARLVATAVAVLFLLVVLLAATVTRQRAVLLDQVDEQLGTVAAALSRAPRAIAPIGPLAEQAAQTPPTGDFYFAVLRPDGELQAIVTPVSHPGFAPESDGLAERAIAIEPGDVGPIEPFTVDSVDGPGRARTIVVEVQPNLAVVVARSTDRVDEAQRQLALTAGAAVVAVAAVLALVLWWVDRLGLQPISRLTQAAEDVAAGRSERRVEHPPTTTEAGRLGSAFNTMLDARQEAEERQRRFVADASHELRTPLTTLRGYAALHASGGLTSDEAIDDAMGRIRGEADRMTGLVENLLALASLDEERPLDLTSVDLSQLLVDIGADAAAVQPTRAVDTGGVQPGLVVLADRDLLTQAVTAATSNTLRHTPTEAGLTLSATARLAVAGGDGPTVRIEISDLGPGIAADHLPHLFDRFYRADYDRAAAGGRGLGLSIARTVVEAHGGTIAASSPPGQGATITIELPVDGASGPPSPS
ncbi:MAG: HAMP domain-containing sensor histidine kinase [Actinomycetota bacterium]